MLSDSLGYAEFVLKSAFRLKVQPSSECVISYDRMIFCCCDIDHDPVMFIYELKQVRFQLLAKFHSSRLCSEYVCMSVHYIYDTLFHFVVVHLCTVGVYVLGEVFVSVCFCVYLHYTIV